MLLVRPLGVVDVCTHPERRDHEQSDNDGGWRAVARGTLSGFDFRKGLAGGTLPIDRDAAVRAIQETLCARLDLSAVDVAYGIHQVANAAMMRTVPASSGSATSGMSRARMGWYAGRDILCFAGRLTHSCTMWNGPPLRV